MNNKNLKKISDVPYKGDKKTITQQLTKEQIEDLCDGYKKTNFENLKLLHHVRYFVIDKKTKESLFRMGGTILKIVNENAMDNEQEKKYVVLTNGSVNWTVQKENTIFLQAKSIKIIEQELNEKYGDIIAKQNDEIKALNKYVNHLKKIITEQEEQINKLSKPKKNEKNK